MLEKMGWQHGKGLGANEDGITEHIKVKHKNDTEGMGYKETNDQWTEHETNFSALLESLTGTIKKDEIKLHSLEKKSETSRARVHYHKFTRGKDLSRYSEKDLANIFGKKSLKESKKEEVKEEPSSNIEKLEKDSKFLINSGSMRDYFKKKWPSFGQSNGIGNAYVVGPNGVLQKSECDSETEARPSFSFNEVNSEVVESNAYAGFGFKSEVKETESQKISTFISYVNEDNVESDKKKKKKKRKGEVVAEVTPKKKSKIDSPRPSKNEDRGLSNPAFNPLYTPVRVEKHVLDTIEETFSEDTSVTVENGVENVETLVEVHEVKKYGKKSKNRVENDSKTVEEICDGVVIEEESIEEPNLSDSSRISKKRKKNKSLSGINNLNFEEVSLDNSQFVESSVEVKTEETLKKKKKKDKLAVENPAFSESYDESTGISQIEENPYEVQTLGKKKKKKLALENPSFNASEEDSVDVSRCENNAYEVKPKKKKEKQTVEKSEDFTEVEDSEAVRKKKKKRKEPMAIENPGFNVSVEESSEVVQVEENPYEIKKRKKNKALQQENSISDGSIDTVRSEENSYEIKTKKKKKKKIAEMRAIENPAFSDLTDSLTDLSQIEENSYDVIEQEHIANSLADTLEHEENSYEIKRKKKKKNEFKAIVNPSFDDATVSVTDLPQLENAFEVERKKKSKKRKEDRGIANPCLDLDSPASEVKENISLNVEESDLMLNIVTTPILVRPKTEDSNATFSITKVNSVKRRKSVRFSDVTQERIIPNNDDLINLSDIENRNELFDINMQVLNSSLEDQRRGLDNLAFDKRKNRIEENVDLISKKLEGYQAEIENDINEKKMEEFGLDDVMVGEVGNPHGDNEKLDDGTKLKFKYAHFLSTRTPMYQSDRVGPKKGYRHLIKGDIVVKFNNTNLHRIEGYAVKNKGAIV